MNDGQILEQKNKTEERLRMKNDMFVCQTPFDIESPET